MCMGRKIKKEREEEGERERKKMHIIYDTE